MGMTQPKQSVSDFAQQQDIPELAGAQGTVTGGGGGEMNPWMKLLKGGLGGLSQGFKNQQQQNPFY
jgi:hypothetical protein